MNEILYKIGIAYNNWRKTRSIKIMVEKQFENNKNGTNIEEYYLNNKEKIKQKNTV
jgi:hypothetical protein